jgi:hypothetical protein
MRGLYTGDPNASDSLYNAAVTGSGAEVARDQVAITFNFNTSVSTPFGGFSTGGPEGMISFNLGTGDVDGYATWNSGSFEASSNSTKNPYSGNGNVTALFIYNSSGGGDLRGPAVGFNATVIGPGRVGANVYYGQNMPNGSTMYGFGPSWGTPGATIDAPVGSFTTPPGRIYNLYGL